MAAKSVSSFVLFSLALISLSISYFVSLWAQCVREGELRWLAGSEVSVTVWGGDGQSSPTLRKQRTHMQELAWLSPFLSDPTPALQLTECVSVCWVCVPPSHAHPHRLSQALTRRLTVTVLSCLLFRLKVGKVGNFTLFFKNYVIALKSLAL